MSAGVIIWLILCVLVGVTWVVRHVALNRAVRSNRRLSPRSHAVPGADAPRVSVLVAAKDEQDNIEVCLRTLAAQDYPNFELIAINDRSTDDTGQIMNQLQAEYPDLIRVVHVKHLAEGWFGKNNAMRMGVAKSTGDWLCFLDADCRQTSISTLSMAVQEALANGIDFLSVLPVLETKSFWERVIQPVCAAILVTWFSPERVNDPSSRVAYANGAFMLMTRQNYEAIGGHASVRTELNEDIHMARLTKEAGRRLYVVENDGLYLTRMYSSFAESWRGWSRIFYGCFKTFPRLLLITGVVAMASVFPFVSLVVATIMYATRTGDSARPWAWVLAFSVVVVIVLESVICRFMSVVRAAPWAWLTYPVGAALGVGMLIAAIRKIGGATTTTWRGTTYRADKHVDEPRTDERASDGAVQSAPDVA